MGPSNHYELTPRDQRKQTPQACTWLVIIHKHHGCIGLLQVQSLVYKAAVAALDHNRITCSKQHRGKLGREEKQLGFDTVCKSQQLDRHLKMCAGATGSLPVRYWPVQGPHASAGTARMSGTV